MLLISMLSVVYSKFQWNESVQFATLPFRNVGFKVQVCMAREGGGRKWSLASPVACVARVFVARVFRFVSFSSCRRCRHRRRRRLVVLSWSRV